MQLSSLKWDEKLRNLCFPNTGKTLINQIKEYCTFVIKLNKYLQVICIHQSFHKIKKIKNKLQKHQTQHNL